MALQRFPINRGPQDASQAKGGEKAQLPLSAPKGKSVNLKRFPMGTGRRAGVAHEHHAEGREGAFLVQRHPLGLGTLVYTLTPEP